MNILILVNTGPGFPGFFWQLGSILRQKGHSVFYALDSPLVAYEEPAYRTDKQVSVFSEFYSKYVENPRLLKDYEDNNIWEIFFSDFDRYQSYRINLDKTMTWYRKLACGLIDFFTDTIRMHNIDVFIYEPITNSFAAWAFLVAQRLGVAFVGLSSSRLPARFEIHTSLDGIRNKLQNNFIALESGDAKIPPTLATQVDAYLADFNTIVPDYMSTNSLDVLNIADKYAKKQKLDRILQRLAFVFREPPSNYPYQLGNPLVYSANQFKRSLSRSARSFGLKRLFSKPDPADRYYLYPLHFHPEASTSVYARHYVDEAIVIKNIAFNLPFWSTLYVKDHVSAFAAPNKNFYRSLRDLPNVKLIAPNEDTKELIRRSMGVITLTSTVGYEALVLNKPVFVLGDVFYDFHPLCRKVGSWSDLHNLLKRSLTRPEQTVLARYLVAAYFQCTYPGRLDFSHNEPSHDIIEAVCDFIAQKV